MLTVCEVEGLNAWDVVTDWLSSDKAVIPEEILVPPGETQQQVDRANTDQFQQSQSSAITSALRHEGYPVQVHDRQGGDRASPPRVICSRATSSPRSTARRCSPAPISSRSSSRSRWAPRSRSASREPESPSTTQIKTIAGSDGKPQIGVSVEQKQPSPLTVKFELENVGGPSAGHDVHASASSTSWTRPT